MNDPYFEQVSETVSAYVQPDGSWFVNNAALIEAPDHLICVDTVASVERTRAFQRRIAERSDKPVRIIVNTHHHGDHTYGNFLFDQAIVVGHSGTRRGVLAAGQPPGPEGRPSYTPFDFGPIELAPPTLTFEDQITLWAGDLACRVQHVGQVAHTADDSYLHLVDEGVLIAGDLLFSGGTPFVMMGSLSGLEQVLTEQLKPLQARKIIPGHGPVRGPELIDEVLSYLDWVQRLAADGRRRGLSPLEAARGAELGRFAGWTDTERVVANLHRAYAEADGLPPAESLDYRGIVAEMVQWRGGEKIHVCL